MLGGEARKTLTENDDRRDPAVVIEIARSVMHIQRADLVGTWPRVAAILGRQALEMALNQLWSEVEPGVENATKRAQMLCLPEYVDAELAQRVTYAWHGLSAACHHHAYDLPPVASELNGWLNEVAALIKEVDRKGSK